MITPHDDDFDAEVVQFKGLMDDIILRMGHRDHLRIVVDCDSVLGIPTLLAAQHTSRRYDFARLYKTKVEKLVKTSEGKYTKEYVDGYSVVQCDKSGMPQTDLPSFEVLDPQGAVAALWGMLVCIHAEPVEYLQRTTERARNENIMSIMAIISDHTHFALEGKHSYRLHKAEVCDDCGETVYDNGPTLHAPKSGSVSCWLYDTKEWLVSNGVKPLPEGAVMDSLYYRESDHKTCCGQCCQKAG